MSILTIVGIVISTVGGLISAIGGAQDATKTVEKTIYGIFGKKD